MQRGSKQSQSVRIFAGAVVLALCVFVWASFGSRAAPATLVGIVHDGSGRPVVAAHVALFRLDNLASAAVATPLITESGRDGRFRFDRLDRGRYGISANAVGSTAAFAAVILGPGEPPDVEIDLGQAGFDVSGMIEARQSVLASADVIAVRWSNEGPQYFFTQTTKGEYSLKLPRGSYSITARAPLLQSAQENVDVTADQRVNFHLVGTGRIRGRVVVKATGEALPGIHISADGNGDFAGATSGDDGRFELGGLRPGRFELSAHGRGWVGRGRSGVELAAGGIAEGADIDLVAGRAVRGRVVDARGKPIADAEIHMGGGWYTDAETNKDGNFAVDNIWPAVGWVQVRASSYVYGSARFDATRHDVSGLRIVLERGSRVDGIVLDPNNRPVVGVTVKAFVSSDPDAFNSYGATCNAETRTDSVGRFVLEGLCAGHLQVRVFDPEFGSGRAKLTVEPHSHGSVEVSLGGATDVAGQVTWQDGSPAAGVYVIAQQEEIEHEQVTGADGRFALGPFGSGSLSLVASRKRHKQTFAPVIEQEPDRRQVSLSGGQHLQDFRLVVQRGGQRIAGIVVGPNGASIANAEVGALQENERGWTGVRVLGHNEDERVISDRWGCFSIEDLESRKYTVWARAPGLPGAELQHVPAGATSIRLQMEPPAKLSGRLVREGGGGLADAVVTLRSMDRVIEDVNLGVHDPAGAFDISALGPGKYVLYASTRDGRLGWAPPFDLAKGEHRTLPPIPLAPGASIHGRLVHVFTRRPLGGEEIHVIPDRDRDRGFDLQTDVNGEFRVGNVLPHDPVTISFGKSFCWLGSVEWRLRTGELTELGDIAAFPSDEMSRHLIVVWRAGIAVKNREGEVVVDQVLEASSAAKAGVHPGERLLSVDGQPVRGVASNSVMRLLEGDDDSTVVVELAAPGQPPRPVVLRRRWPGRP